MTCQEADKNLSLYLYGELDFAEEDALEQHIAACENCRRALAREKAWHSAVKSDETAAPFEFLASCRRDLKAAIGRNPRRSRSSMLDRIRSGWPFGVSLTASSAAVALASLLLCIGFTAGQWVDRHGVPGIAIGPAAVDAGLVPVNTRVRDIQPAGNNRVRIMIDQTREQEITGSLADQDVRRWLLAAAQDPADPGLRVDGIELLRKQTGTDIRDAFLDRLRHDSNAGVRLESVEGLRQFRSDPAVQETLMFAVEHDYDPGVRSEAIDVLAPLGGKASLTPQLADTLGQILRSGEADEYVQMRCARVLQAMKSSPDVY
jgi:hypothetical protein